MKYLKIVKVFFFGFLIDIMYVGWLKAVEADSLLLAGVASVGITLPGLLGILEIVDNKRMMIPYFMGLFFGTICGIIAFS